jgi:hypothetical protein
VDPGCWATTGAMSKVKIRINKVYETDYYALFSSTCAPGLHVVDTTLPRLQDGDIAGGMSRRSWWQSGMILHRGCLLDLM